MRDRAGELAGNFEINCFTISGPPGFTTSRPIASALPALSKNTDSTRVFAIERPWAAMLPPSEAAGVFVALFPE